MTKDELIKLQLHLNQSNYDADPIGYVHGFLSSTACSPIIINPSMWVNHILNPGREDTSKSSALQIEEAVSLLLNLYNDILGSLSDETYQPVYTLGANKVTPESANLWAKGFLDGVELWGDLKEEEQNKVSDILLSIIIIGSPESFFKLSLTKKELSEIDKTEILNEALKEIPDSVINIKEYFNYYNSIEENGM